MYLAVAPVLDPVANAPTDQWRVCPLAVDGTAAGPERLLDAAGVRDAEADQPRWLVDSTARVYPDLLAAAGVLRRSHDVTLTERILLSRDGRAGQAASASAVHARAAGLPVPADLDPGRAPDGPQWKLFDTDELGPAAPDPLLALTVAIADQLPRIGTDNALRLLVAAESTSALTAVEMGAAGLPWDVVEHDRLLTEALGPRPSGGARPAKLAALADQISTAFGFAVNPGSVARCGPRSGGPGSISTAPAAG